MEELAIKIAETLDISVQAAIDMYPVIRSQYIWYQTLINVLGWALVLGFILMVLTGITFSIRDDTKKYDFHTEKITEEWANIDKTFKKELSVLALLVVIGIVASMIIPFLAPDIMLLKEFIGS